MKYYLTDARLADSGNALEVTLRDASGSELGGMTLWGQGHVATCFHSGTIGASVAYALSRAERYLRGISSAPDGMLAAFAKGTTNPIPGARIPLPTGREMRERKRKG